MSESPSDRTVRQYLKLHLSTQWRYQHTVFYVNPEDSVSLLTDQVRFKEALRKHAPDQPFLCRIQLLDKDGVQEAIMVIYTTGKVHGLTELACKTFKQPMNTLGRGLPDSRRDGAAATIKREHAHNLAEFFEKPSVRRFTVLNKPLIEPSLQYKNKTPVTALDNF
ncbi:hypothetical protein [Bacillus cereus]|uniref:hypothetical protein n=1 Tax=Bacillus cereus TaxID=1396 RepID=UPI003D655333